MQWRDATVEQVRDRWPGAVEYLVRLAPGDAQGDAPGAGESVRALAYTAMVGEPQVGDRVLLNASALLRGLGTGGLAFVVVAPQRLLPDPAAPAGHIVKARYTPQQQMFLAVDEQDSPHRAVMTGEAATAGDLDGMPVVVADLHSALPAVLAGLRLDHPAARAVYVMTDGGALPLAFSRTVAGLTEAGWLAGTVTVGQAYGGELEAVTLHSGLLAARLVLGADVAVVVQGPGNVGTGTTWGYTGVAAGEALNAAVTLGGRGVAALRVSGADPRDRHRGISHHSLTAYGRVCLVGADLPVPAPPGTTDRATTEQAPPGEAILEQTILEQAHALVRSAAGSLTVREVARDGLDGALRRTPVALSTMGRGLEDDYLAFLYNAAAGRHAARLLSEGD